MLFLKILLGIILFFVLILSVKFRVTVHSEDGVDLTVRWLFLKFKILPKKEKPEKKKKKKKKKEDTKEDKKKDETVPEPKPPKAKKKGDNIFVRFYHNNGVEGVVDLIKRFSEALKTGMGKVMKSFTFEELYISLLVGAGDSAETAIKYGKTCAAVFPAMGLITDTMRVNKYSLDVNPDFIYGKNNARLHVQLSVIPRRLINSFIGLGVRIVFKVVLEFLKGSKAKKTDEQKEENNNK